MVFPKNNLPTQSQPWTRDVEKRVENLESSFRSAEVNNVTRDSQTLSQVRRLDAAVTDVAQAAADAATAAANAQAAIDGLGSLDESTSTYKISAANITVGSLSGDRISGGEIVGTTLKTGTTGRRVEIQSTNTSYFDENNNFTGRILGAGTDRGATLELTSGASGELQVWNGGVIMYGAAGTYAALSDNGFGVGGNRLYTIGTNIESGSAIISSTDMTSGGSLTRSQLIGGGTTGASFTNGGNLVRTSSSERYKTDIQLLDINLNDLYELEPKTFKRIEEVQEDPDGARTYPGFIAEELAGTSLDKFVFYSQDEDGNSRPEGIHYPELTAALLIAIKDLNTRIQVLEGRV